MNKELLIKKRVIQAFLVIVLMQCFADLHAYIGPGAGISSVGLALAFLVILLLLFIGFIWYPVKKIFFRDKKNNKDKEVPLGKDSDKARKI